MTNCGWCAICFKGKCTDQQKNLTGTTRHLSFGFNHESNYCVKTWTAWNRDWNGSRPPRGVHDAQTHPQCMRCTSRDVTILIGKLEFWEHAEHAAYMIHKQIRRNVTHTHANLSLSEYQNNNAETKANEHKHDLQTSNRTYQLGKMLHRWWKTR